MQTAIFKKKRTKFYLKELKKVKNKTKKLPINTIIPNFCYKNKKGEIIVPKISVFL
ncbi:hypothetical protein SAMN04488111_3270 [Lutibacter flavus]|uniref:Uncharacterized protein n=1 Tax=Lutibacter flavus TaxID=691689 RepID=A0A238ZET6_9FLAO|nr:hypothetical protein SAMN04488111_3270 [Lutibacter flavus]